METSTIRRARVLLRSHVSQATEKQSGRGKVLIVRQNICRM